MDGLESNSLSKASGDGDFFHDLLHFAPGNESLGFHEDNTLLDILSTPICSPHGDIPPEQLSHPTSLPSTIEEVYRLSGVTPSPFMQGVGEEDEGRPLLDIVTPVSSSFSAISSTCDSASTAGIIPGSSGDPHRSTTASYLPASTLIADLPSPVHLHSCNALSTAGRVDTTASNQHNLFHFPSGTLSRTMPPQAHPAAPPDLVHKDHTIASSLPVLLQGVELDSLSEEGIGVLESSIAASLGSLMDLVKQALPGVAISSADLTQLLNSLCGNLQQTLPVFQERHFPTAGLPDFLPSLAPARSVTLNATPTTSVALTAAATNGAESVSVLETATPDIPETLQQVNPTSIAGPEAGGLSLPSSTVGTTSDLDDSDWEDMHSSVAQRFTHIDWTDRQRASQVPLNPAFPNAPAMPATKEQPLIEESSTKAVNAEEDREKTPTKSLPSRKRHAGGWPKGRPRKKVKQVLAEKPKLPLTGYAIFLSEKRRQVIDEYPEKAMNEINRVLGRIWSTMDNNQKRQYYEKASTDKKRYLSEIRLFLTARLKGMTDETVASMLMQNIDKQYAKVLQNEQDNDMLHCELCDKRFVNIANKFNHLESKPHLVILAHTLEKMAAVLVTQHLQQTGKLPDRGRNKSVLLECTEPEDVSNTPSPMYAHEDSEIASEALDSAFSARSDPDVPSVSSVCCKSHTHSITDVVVRDPLSSAAVESCIELGSMIQGPTSSLMKLLNDFGKVVSAIDKTLEEKKVAFSNLQRQHVDLQMAAGQWEYMSHGVHQELSGQREEYQVLQKDLLTLESLFE